MSRKKPLPKLDRREGGKSSAIPAKLGGKRAGPAAAASPANAPTKTRKPFPTYLPLAIIFGLASVIAVVLILKATAQGIGVITDSTVYLDVARNLLRGSGFTQSAGTPLTHYPPLYPAALALAGIFGPDVVAGAKWLHIILYVANVLLVGLIVYRGTWGSVLAATAGLLFMLTSWPVLFNHVYALSEALFIFFTLAALLIINEYLYRNYIFMLVAAIFIIVLAGMTRYIGFMLIPMISLIILTLENDNFIKKLTKVIIINTLCAIPLLVWIIRNIIISNTIVNRKLLFHPIQLKQVQIAIETVSTWFFVPSSLHLGLKLLILVIIFSFTITVLAGMVKRLGILSHLNRTPLICSFFLCLYAAALLFSIFFVEPNLPLNDHYLLPFYIVLGTGLICMARNAFQPRESTHWIAVLTVALSIAFLLVQGEQTVRLLKPLSENGVGFTDRTWKLSKAMEFVRRLPDDTPVYSNAPDAIAFLTGRQTMMMPRRQKPASGDGEANSGKTLEGMIQHLEHSKGFLIHFKLLTWRGYLPGVEELKQRAELQSIYEGWDGTIFQARPVPESSKP